MTLSNIKMKSVANDEEFHELYSKLRDLIEDTNYIDIIGFIYCATLCYGRF